MVKEKASLFPVLQRNNCNCQTKSSTNNSSPPSDALIFYFFFSLGKILNLIRFENARLRIFIWERKAVVFHISTGLENLIQSGENTANPNMIDLYG